MHRFRVSVLLALSFLAAGCSSPARRPAAPLVSQNDNQVTVPPNAGVYKIGQPYQIEGIWYYPAEQPDYDETGIASWYGPDFYGKRTANGEMYDGNALTAAHRTLPLPVNVRVTNLENGKSIIVRINDRGPYARGRIIDLSRRAAELLDVVQTGTARVRVTYVGRADINGRPASELPPEIANALPAAPSGQVTAAPLSGQAANPAYTPGAQTPPAPIPQQMFADAGQPNQPTGQVTEVPVQATHLYVQVGAFSKLENARTLLNRLGGDLRISTLQRGGQTLYRVRTGPLNTTQDADAALARITGLGSNDAQIVVDQ